MMNFTFEHVSGSCKYHRDIGRVYTFKDLVPEGLCPHAYFVAYPYCLGLLHEAKFSWMKNIDENTVIAQCPAPSNPIVMKIWRDLIPKEKRKTDKDDDRYNIFIELVEKLEDSTKVYKSCQNCAQTMKVERKWEFNKGQLAGICPAAFNQMFPYLVALENGGHLDWQNKDGSVTLPCPDNISKVNFLVKVV
ncbi:TIGR04076 family protein [Patescibacteria group bacterium]